MFVEMVCVVELGCEMIDVVVMIVSGIIELIVGVNVLMMDFLF